MTAFQRQHFRPCVLTYRSLSDRVIPHITDIGDASCPEAAAVRSSDRLVTLLGRRQHELPFAEAAAWLARTTAHCGLDIICYASIPLGVIRIHFHLPKPLHGWREFAGEVGIIVLGVLIALTAEQLISSIHDRNQVRHGEDSLRDNFERFVRFTAELDNTQPCLRNRAAEIRSLIDHAALTRRLPDVGPIPEPPNRPWQIDTFGAMVASQAITHVPNDREVQYSRVSMSAVDLYEDAVAEWNDWGVLQSLSGPSRPFGEAEEAQARATLARAVHNDALMHRIADATVERIENTHLLDASAFDRDVEQGKADAAHSAMCEPVRIRRAN